MILVQKPFILPSSTQSPLYTTHRRHPSAPPTVLVQPTRTPGLLTLSKPHNQRQNQRQTPKPLPKSNSTPVVRAPPLNSPAEITLTKKSGVITLPATPSPQPRGRGQVNNPKDKVQNQRSPSYPSVRGKHGRQLSPIPQSQLQQIPSQAEAAVISSINSTNLFDPFIDNDSSLSSNPPSPTLPFQPSGNLANRRQRPLPSLVHSEAIPVPAAARRQTPNISRSVPLPSRTRQRPRPISTRPSTFQHFPICDDMNDAADVGVPTTPLNTRRHYDNGLQTAPISTHAPGAFPLNTIHLHSPSSPVANRRKNRKHHRTPSEGVFHMSSDEDISSGPDGSVLNPNVKALFGLPNNFNHSLNMIPSTPIRAIPPYKRDSASPSNGSFSKERQSEREAAEKAAGYFASSMFQNSPSPEELPDPLLL